MVGWHRNASQDMHDETAQGMKAALILAGQFFLDVEHGLQPFDTDIAIDQP